MSIGLSFLYPLSSIDPRAVWKGRLVLLLVVLTAAAAIQSSIKRSAWAQNLRRCRRLREVMAVLQIALLVRCLFIRAYISQSEAMGAAILWLGWEGYPLYPRLETCDVYGNPYGPALFQLAGFVLRLFGLSINASKYSD